MDSKYRLITRDDFDGFACCLLLKHLDLIDNILFVHPRQMQQGQVKLGAKDISANLPYVPGIYMAFDHHISETVRVGRKRKNFICNAKKLSAARVIYEYFGMAEKYPHVFEELLTSVDKADSADFTKEDILNPCGWTLFNFILDPKTGFNRFHDFSMTNDQLIMHLADIWNGQPIDEILKLPQIQERVLLYHTYQQHFIDQINRCALVHKNIVIVDYTKEEVIYPGNRFMVYALYPQCDLSLFIQNENESEKVTFSMGRSILKRTSKVNIGELMVKYNGGGHQGAGTCQASIFDCDNVKMDLMSDVLRQCESG